MGNLDTDYELDELNDVLNALERSNDDAYRGARFPTHYICGRFEAKEVIDAIVARAGLDRVQSVDLSNLLKYALRAGDKPVDGDYDKGFESDTYKAANYAHRLVVGEWL